MYKVAVLLSTYNGSKYIKEQIDSILSQEGINIDIYIRDDGSTDETINIISEYKSNNIFLTEGENIGVGNSFMEMIYTVPKLYDYYAFSDQDDIWLNDKLDKAIKLLENNRALLYASNQRCVDKKGDEIGLRYGANEKIHLDIISILQKNMIAGCTMVMSGKLINLLCKNKPSDELLKNRIHDVWVAAVASICGNIVYDNNSYILYRQHENNVGVPNKVGLGKK